jgi:hypothetical protein
VEAVTAGDHVALELLLCAAGVGEPHDRRVAVEPLDAHVGHLEQQLPARVDALGDEVLDDLLLAVQRDAAATRQVAERDAPAVPVPAQE